MKINYTNIRYTIIPLGYPPQSGGKRKSVNSLLTLFDLTPLTPGYICGIMVYLIPSVYFTFFSLFSKNTNRGEKK